jgi:hypothetical protein
LFFSHLALININTTETIQDEPKVLANFLLTDTTDADVIVSYCGIEYRGGVSKSYPKKSYDIELWKDEEGNNSNKLPLLNMRNDDDWILIGMFNEPLRIRSAINHKLWRDIHAPYYIKQEEDAMAGIRTKYIELAINNEYMGIYSLCEQVDKKQLQLKKYNTTIRGELYKGIGWGASTFTSLTSFDNDERLWSGFEFKYPKEDEDTDWSNLYNLVDFVINSTQTNFENDIENFFVLDNAIDYFIFLNFLRATDNTGKNIYIAKYKENEPYFYIPWDLDGTYGIIWNGEQENTYDDIFSNGLYDRLLNSDNNIFNSNASNRWFELRNTNVIDYDVLTNKISQSYNLLSSNGNYEREIIKWGKESIDTLNLNYTYEWIENRLNFLDSYFGSVILKINNHKNEPTKLSAFPNPIFSTFRIKHINKPFFYYIYNLNGTLLKKGFSHENELINIENFPKGFYILKVKAENNNKFINLKIIKE